jgi:hypothetical protein
MVNGSSHIKKEGETDIMFFSKLQQAGYALANAPNRIDVESKTKESRFHLKTPLARLGDFRQSPLPEPVWIFPQIA